MIAERLLSTIGALVGTFVSLFVLLALDVQSGVVAAVAFVAITVACTHAVRWRRGDEWLVVRTRGTHRRRVVRARGPFVLVPLIEHVEATVPRGPQVAQSHGEPLVARDGFLVSVTLRVDFEVVDPALATTDLPREAPLATAPLVLRMAGDPTLHPDRAVLRSSRTWLREQAATVDAETLRAQAASLGPRLDRHLQAAVPDWGLAVLGVEVEAPAA